MRLAPNSPAAKRRATTPGAGTIDPPFRPVDCSMLDRSVPPFDHRMCNWEPDAHAAAEANPRDSVATPRMFVMVATEGVDSAKVHISRASLAAADDSNDPTTATLATANKIERIGTFLSLVEEGGDCAAAGAAERGRRSSNERNDAVRIFRGHKCPMSGLLKVCEPDAVGRAISASKSEMIL